MFSSFNGIYIRDKAGTMLRSEGQAGTTEIEITPAMIEAGVAVVDLYGPDAPGRRADWLALVFNSMAGRQVGVGGEAGNHA